MTVLERSRSAIETRRKCPTKRFLGYDYAGTGLQAAGLSLPLAGGIVMHEMLAQVLQAAWMRRDPANAARLDPFEVELDDLIMEGLQAYVAEVRESSGFLNQPKAHTSFLLSEQCYLLEGLVRGWVRYRMPDILEHYDVVSIEQERKAMLVTGLRLPLRIDVLLREKLTGHLVVMDYKSMAYERDVWADSLRDSAQSLLYIQAVERLYDEPCAGIQYEGLFKGARKRGSGRFADRKIQQSLLCYGYRYTPHDKRGKPTGEAARFETEYTGKKGQEKIAMWEHMAAKEWLERYVAPTELALMFQTVPPSRPTPVAMAEEAVSTTRAEREWAQRTAEGIRLSLVAPEEVPAWMGETLEKNRDACRAYGADHKCEFYAICHDRTVASDPLGSGDFVPREDHHGVETQKEAA
jgi:hypothetical protein